MKDFLNIMQKLDILIKKKGAKGNEGRRNKTIARGNNS